jgi:hypothetical protein
MVPPSQNPVRQDAPPQEVDLQKSMPDVHVSFAGAPYCVRDIVNAAAKQLDLKIRCEGGGVEKKPCRPNPPPPD